MREPPSWAPDPEYVNTNHPDVDAADEIDGYSYLVRPAPYHPKLFRLIPSWYHPIRSDHIRSDHIRSDHIRSDPIRSDQIRPDPTRSDPTRSDPILILILTRASPIRFDPIQSDLIPSDPIRSHPTKNPNLPLPAQSQQVPTAAVSAAVKTRVFDLSPYVAVHVRRTDLPIFMGPAFAAHGQTTDAAFLSFLNKHSEHNVTSPL